MRGFYKYLIIIGFVFLFIGYLWKYPCSNFPSVGILKYIYNLKCGVAPAVDNKTNGGTLPNVNNNLNQNTQTQQAQKSGDASLPKTESVGIIYDNKIKNYFVNSKNEVFVVDDLGKIIKITNGKIEIINDSFSGIPRRVIFSVNGEKVLIDFSDLISIFDIKNNSWRQLNPDSFGAHLDLNNNVYYFQKESAGNSIFKLDLSKDNSKPQKLIQLNILDSYLIPKNKDELFIVSKPSSLAYGSVLLFNNNKKDLSLLYEAQGIDFSWDSKTQNGLFLSSGQLNQGGFLFWVNKNLTIQQLSFLTLPSKCIFEENNIPNQTSTNAGLFLICAVPRDQDGLKNRYITDDYLSYELYTEDDIYKIDLNNGRMKVIFDDQTKNFDMDKLQMIDNRIFFINRFDKKLYSIKLNQND